MKSYSLSLQPIKNIYKGIPFPSDVTMEAGKEIRISHEQFTKFELARVLGSRALQISHGAKPLIKLTPKKLEEIGYNPIEIAKLELAEGIIPITVVRKLPGDE